MRKVMIATIIMIIAIGCGAPKEGERAESTKVTAKGEGIPYEKLTEDKLARYMKVLPVFKAEVDKLDKEVKTFDMKKGVGGWTNYYGWALKEYKELDGTLKRSGMGLEELLKTHMNVSMAFVSTFMKQGSAQQKEAIANMENQLKDPKLGKQQKEMLEEQIKALKQSAAEMETMFEEIPKENIEIVKKHQEELQKLFESLD